MTRFSVIKKHGDLNTSYVDIKHLKVPLLFQFLLHLNTSYVDIKPRSTSCVKLIQLYLNTSYVDIKLLIYHKRHTAISI